MFVKGQKSKYGYVVLQWFITMFIQVTVYKIALYVNTVFTSYWGGPVRAVVSPLMCSPQIDRDVTVE